MTRDAQSPPASDLPLTVEERLLSGPRRTAGIDTHGEPVRIGELDSEGCVVGYVDEDGLAWPSLSERIITFASFELAAAMTLPRDHPRRSARITDATRDVPPELMSATLEAAQWECTIRDLFRRVAPEFPEATEQAARRRGGLDDPAV